MTRQLRRTRVLVAALSCIAATAPALAAQTSSGTIEGTITDAASGRTIIGAQIVVVGTNFGATSNERGVYRITGIPPRQVELRARVIGYAPVARTVTVAAGETARADFRRACCHPLCGPR